ncbi:hypothetical protein AB6A40_005127 [Gnathostoma spinigerum]|uniref:DNA replication complex GINS protein PSF3 n=1 Tax=Gnathostoma spinigerum TaxID=75299 RepID=A0ABD6EN65_9BILA
MPVEEVDADYYDLSDIIASSSNITCTFSKNNSKDIFPLFGQKRPENITDKGFKAEVPLFIAEAIRRTCRVHFPKAYNIPMQEVLQANACCINLGSMQQQFYLLGKHISLLVGGEEGRLLAECLLNTFVQRIGLILTKSLNSDRKPDKLDSYEKDLYEIGINTDKWMRKWTSSVRKDRKRKLPSSQIS